MRREREKRHTVEREEDRWRERGREKARETDRQIDRHTGGVRSKEKEK